MILKHLPNALSISRLILIVPFLLCLYEHQYRSAFYIFIIAGLTDGLDGWLARHFGWKSVFGSFIDPLGDKLLIAASFLSLALLNILPWWLVIIVFARDLTISCGVLLWNWFIQRKFDFRPTFLSKLNTFFQLSLVTVCLFQLAYFAFPSYIISLLIIITAITTITSYIDYVWTWGKKACLECQIVK